MNWLFALVAISLLSICNAASNPKMVCYYESWAYWRQGLGKMTVNDIDSSLCTHIVYAYLGITETNTVNILDPYLMDDLNDLSNFARKKGNAKAMVAIGGSTQSSRYISMAASESDRTTFVNSVIKFLSKYKFDGVMIDWQYPQHSDINNYVKLLDKFDELFVGTSYILGVTGAPLNAQIDDGFDVKNIVRYVDFIHVLTYDYHGPWDSKVYYSAPLVKQLNSLEYWVQKGAPKDKLLMSVPLFGRSWKLTHAEDNEIESRGSGAGEGGPYSQTPGLIGYNELCHMMKSSPNDFLIRRSTTEPAVYAVHGQNWISYEDKRTLEEKAQQAIKHGYAGMVAYALSSDDFKAECGSAFPLLHGISSGLKNATSTT